MSRKITNLKPTLWDMKLINGHINLDLGLFCKQIDCKNSFQVNHFKQDTQLYWN